MNKRSILFYTKIKSREMRNIYAQLIICLLISPSYGQWNANGDNITQGSVKLGNYLLFDSDGDFTGGNYFTIQDDATDDFLRLGRGFESNLVIGSNGYIGIGIDNPQKPLVVNGVTQFLSPQNSSNFLHFDYASNGNKVRSYGTNLFLESRNSTEDIEIRTDNSETSLMIVKGTGNVGIGTTNPDYKLDINGSLRLGIDGSSGLGITRFTSALSDVPGSTSGILFNGPIHSHIVFDIQGNDQNDGFYIRIPDVLQVNPTVNTTAFVVKANGNVGIGINPTEKLTVDGKIRSEEVKVEIVNGPDYVFEPDYQLRTLQETKAYISEHKHLPEIPSAKEMEANGVALGDMNMKLLKKIEELTLYQIDLLEELDKLKSEVATLKNEK